MASDPLRQQEQMATASVGVLVEIYARAATRLQVTIRTAITGGRLDSARFRARQLKAVQKILVRLRREGAGVPTSVLRSAFGLGDSKTTDSILKLGGPNANLGGAVSQKAVNALALAVEGKLDAAIGEVGRSATDVFKEVGLRETAIGLASGSGVREITKRQVEAYAKQGIAGFVDRTGRRWRLDSYANMVARTTTREAATIGSLERTKAAGLDLYRISTHSNPCPICTEFDGNTYSISGRTKGYPRLVETPPFHPNCEHVGGPAPENF